MGLILVYPVCVCSCPFSKVSMIELDHPIHVDHHVRRPGLNPDCMTMIANVTVG